MTDRVEFEDPAVDEIMPVIAAWLYRWNYDTSVFTENSLAENAAVLLNRAALLIM